MESKLKAIAEALERMDLGADRVTCKRVRWVEYVDEGEESLGNWELDDLGIDHEQMAMVVAEGPLVLVMQHGATVSTRPRVARVFSVEMLDQYTPREVALLLAAAIREKFETMPDVPDWADE